ncbi:hypothetical protein B0H19DRAFT_101135 [Mycena capillaripes]|nr:hypothetical protein B0H19DRAFT_101135 [Mycena capillaripes]
MSLSASRKQCWVRVLLFYFLPQDLSLRVPGFINRLSISTLRARSSASDYHSCYLALVLHLAASGSLRKDALINGASSLPIKVCRGWGY